MVDRARPAVVDAASTVPLAEVFDQVAATHPDAELSDAGAQALATFTSSLIASDARPLPSPWASLLGPVATPKVVVELLGGTRQGLDKARDRGAVLGVRTANGRWVYPLRQFRGARRGRVRVLDGLAEVLATLDARGDGTAAARWLATPNRRLDRDTPWAVLEEGERIDAVVAAAGAQARAWTGR